MRHTGGQAGWWRGVWRTTPPGAPATWLHDQTLLDRPGNDEVQLALFRDYPTNIDGYPQLQEYFCTSQVPLLAVWQVPLLAVWGAGDEIFGPDGVQAFTRDLPDSEVHTADWALRPGDAPRRHQRLHPRVPRPRPGLRCSRS